MKLKCLIFVFAIGNLSHKCALAADVQPNADSVLASSLILPLPENIIKNLTSNGQEYRVLRIVEYLIPTNHKKLKAIEPKKQNRAEKQSSVKNNSTKSRNTSSSIITNFIFKVREHSKVICSASLISKKAIISSTRCFPKMPLATNYKAEDITNKLHDVKKVLLGTPFGSEVALLELTRDLLYLKPIPLCQNDLHNSSKVIMYLTETRVNFLRTEIIDSEDCRQSYASNKNVFVTENMLCTHNSNVAQDCKQMLMGDPLVYDGKLCGVNIYEPQCKQDAVNGAIFVNIFKSSGYIDAIMECMDK